MDAKAWAEVALGRLRLPPRALRVWTWVLVLAPLAWVGGLALRYQITTHTWPEAALDRAGALHKASLEAQRKGVDVHGWRESIELHANTVLDQAMQNQPPALRRWLYENDPPRSLVAGFESARTGEKLTYDLNLHGEMTGFHEGCAERWGLRGPRAWRGAQARQSVPQAFRPLAATQRRISLAQRDQRLGAGYENPL
jgi:hypothetical protein